MTAMMTKLENEIINLTPENLVAELDAIIGDLKEGDTKLLFCKNDFSDDLVNLMNQKYTNLPLKAKLLMQGDQGVQIKIVYPDAKGGGCCGCCS